MIKEGWNGFNVLHTAASRVGGLDLGFVPGPNGRDVAGIVAGAKSGAIDVVYLLGADEIDMNALGDAFVIYQGHHGDAAAHRADIILPGAAYTEKDATYVNTEGRVQRAQQATTPPGDAREDWKILRALSQVLGKTLPYDSLAAIRARLVAANDTFRVVDRVLPAHWEPIAAPANLGGDAQPFRSPIENFYMTDPISRASVTMAKCSEVQLARAKELTGTHA
jgi:NADH-quinone oxidoreductase subunit G